MQQLLTLSHCLGISQSDLLVINKTDIAQYVGASLEVMRRDAAKMRDGGPTVFTSVKHNDGVDAVIDLILAARAAAPGADKAGKPLEA
jgi:urease accessory protein